MCSSGVVSEVAYFFFHAGSRRIGTRSVENGTAPLTLTTVLSKRLDKCPPKNVERYSFWLNSFGL